MTSPADAVMASNKKCTDAIANSLSVPAIKDLVKTFALSEMKIDLYEGNYLNTYVYPSVKARVLPEKQCSEQQLGELTISWQPTNDQKDVKPIVKIGRPM